MSDVSTVLGAAAGTLTGIGFTSVVVNLLLQRRTEKKLVESIQKQANIVKALEIMRHALEAGRLEPDAIANAKNLIDIAAQNLSKSQKEDVFHLLGRGSERSQANYLAKLIDEIDIERTNPYEDAHRVS